MCKRGMALWATFNQAKSSTLTRCCHIGQSTNFSTERRLIAWKLVPHARDKSYLSDEYLHSELGELLSLGPYVDKRSLDVLPLWRQNACLFKSSVFKALQDKKLQVQQDAEDGKKLDKEAKEKAKREKKKKQEEEK